MPKKLSKNLHNRLESLFSGIFDSAPQTGPLTPELLGLADRPGIRGWLWESNPDGSYRWSSPEVEQHLGYAAEELVGKPVSEFSIAEDARSDLKAALETGDPIRDLQVSAENSQGQALILVLNAMVRTAADGESIGLRGVWQVLQIEDESQVPVQITRPKEVTAAEIPREPDLSLISEMAAFVDENGNVRSAEADPDLVQIEPQMDNGTLAIPIRTVEGVLGSIEFEAEDDGPAWTQEDLSLVEEVSQQLATAIQDARTVQLTEQALEELREADRLKSQFLANMSHELRTPLNSIIGFSRVILKGIDGPINETQEKDLSAIYSAGQHLLGLINDMLDLSKIEAGKMELAFSEIDLAELIRSVMSTAIGLVKDKPIELVSDIPEDMPTIQADSIRVRQIMLNLLSNAAKFTDEGQIGVSARLMKDKHPEQVIIAVFDSGSGIAAEEQHKLFEPFSQVDASPTRKTGGTGLGLSISAHLVELHGGRIWVESTPGQGSTFAFSLPTQQPEPEAIEREQS
jgi:signal transduction histidine kinase